MLGLGSVSGVSGRVGQNSLHNPNNLHPHNYPYIHPAEPLSPKLT